MARIKTKHRIRPKMYATLRVRNVRRPWSNIPLKILLIIVSLLDDPTMYFASCVCRRWRKAIYNRLNQISLSWCMSDLNALTISLVPKFKNVTNLFLRQSKPQIGDYAVITVAKSCPNLVELDITNSLDLSQSSVYALADGCPKLRKLEMSGCSTIQEDTALVYLASRCTQLNLLNLTGCHDIVTDDSLKAIASHCKNMENLSIARCKMVSDEGLTSLALGCPRLRDLSLNGCVLVTNVGVIALAKNCLDLSLVNLKHCPNVSKPQLDEALNLIYSKRETQVESIEDELDIEDQEV